MINSYPSVYTAVRYDLQNYVYIKYYNVLVCNFIYNR